MTFVSNDLISIAIIGIALVLIPTLWHNIQIQKKRIEKFRISRVFKIQFFDLADKLVLDPDTPAVLKQMIVDYAGAISDERIGKSAMQLLMKSSAEFKAGTIKPANQLLNNALSQLQVTRPDLYDAFDQAIRSSFVAILLTHAQSVKITIQYETVGSPQTRLLGMAETVDQGISDLVRNRLNEHQYDFGYAA